MTLGIPPSRHATCREGGGSAPVLTRTLLENGDIAALAAADSPDLGILTQAERAASLRRTLAIRPPGDVWVFGYGSLIWNAALGATERRVARIEGWHRAFCLSITALRASADRPGLMLALDHGGTCRGVAYRLAENDVEHELHLLWRREMVCGAYVPRWVELKAADGGSFGWAIAFTVDAKAARYAGNLDEDTVVRLLATASGALGSAADYLFRTRDSLRANGIHDASLERLALRVEAARADGHQALTAA